MRRKFLSHLTPSRVVVVAVMVSLAFSAAAMAAAGDLDTTFSGDGRQTTEFGDVDGGGATGVALQTNGRIVAVGKGLGPTQTDDLAMARYLGG